MCVYVQYICVCVCTRVIPVGFEAESFPLKYDPITFECKIDSVEIDLHYFK